MGIDARAHEAGSACNHRISGFRVDEIIELRLALVIVAGDAHDVFRVGGGKVGVTAW